MKKIFFLIASTLLLVSCAETMALLGPASSVVSGGNVAQSTVSSVVNYGIKKGTGKTPIQHALAYAEEKNPTRKKERCLSFIERTNSEFCTIAKKQISLTQTAVVNKISSVQNVVKEKKQTVLKKTAAVKHETSNLIKTKKTPKKIATKLLTKIKELDARWLNRREQSNHLRAY